MKNVDLVNKLKNDSVLVSQNIEDAILTVDRADFVTEENLDFAYEDIALPTLSGQTMSQPTTVAFMLEKLELKKGLTVLEIGFGSGWVTALMAKIVGEKGKVEAFEISEDIFNFGANNLKKYDFKNTTLHHGSVAEHLVKGEKYDRIISGAAFGGNVKLIRESLKIGGVAVVPLQNNSIHKITRTSDDFIKENYYGFVFVPIKNN
jgi:protein-L-isoaspartate(D-aspartate) O-methyltransferase